MKLENTEMNTIVICVAYITMALTILFSQTDFKKELLILFGIYSFFIWGGLKLVKTSKEKRELIKERKR